MTSRAFRWGVMGAGQIAHVFCNALRFSESSTLKAIGSKSLSRAESLASRFGCATRYGSYEALARDPQVDGVYVANLNSEHVESALLAVRSGKHVLVEKPIAVSLEGLTQLYAEAKRAQVQVMEGFMYRHHPQLDVVHTIIKSGELGEISSLQAQFAYRADKSPERRLYQLEQGGGVIFDVGCYTSSVSLWLAQLILGDAYRSPTLSRVTAQLGQGGVDVESCVTLCFGGLLSARLMTSLDIELPQRVMIGGSRATLTLLEPWLPSSPCRFATEPLASNHPIPPAPLLLSYAPGEVSPPKLTNVQADKDLFSYQVDHFVDIVRGAPNRWVDDAQTLEHFSLLERWRRAAYEPEGEQR